MASEIILGSYQQTQVRFSHGLSDAFGVHQPFVKLYHVFQWAVLEFIPLDKVNALTNVEGQWGICNPVHAELNKNQ